MCLPSHSAKKCTALQPFPRVEDYFFIDQDEQTCSLIVLVTDINKDVRLKRANLQLDAERDLDVLFSSANQIALNFHYADERSTKACLG